MENQDKKVEQVEEQDEMEIKTDVKAGAGTGGICTHYCDCNLDAA